ncbi:helix-turn-helix transcriptional regulator [Streptomyces albiaxialis]|uniref:Helix-turn-helix transcriptional regulator n=1 Tax=Streptomyces albiaxialis TaxID=329523 RepID=A0ABP5ISR1_9ACTN
MNLEDTGRAAGTSRATVGRYEGKSGAVKWVIVDALCRAYRVPAKERKAVVDLAKSANVQGWWDNYADTIPHRITPLLMLEDEARGEWHWATTYVPGLLQTREYATAVHRVIEPDASADEIERKVDVRMKRQDVLRRPSPLSLSVVLDESVIRREVGGAKIMGEQLRHLVESVGPTLELRVLPFSSGAHPADSPSFMIIRGQEEGLDVVHTSNLTGALFLEKPAELDRHRVVFRQLQELALDPSASADLLAEASERFATDACT